MAMAFEHLNLGLDYCLKVNERVFATRAYTALGMLCSRIGELKKGFYYYKKSLELSRKIGDSVGVQYVLKGISKNSNYLLITYYTGV